MMPTLLRADARSLFCDCGAEIVWAITVNGKRMPVEAHPHPTHGNVYLDETAAGELRATVLPPGKARALRAAKQPLHLSHFSQCPNADQYRRKGNR